MHVTEKLRILTESAKYDVSCASSGSAGRRGSIVGAPTQAGVCHSWAADGRCISLLKVLLSNACIYDCAYCVNRVSHSHRRAAFTPEELVELTLGFYKRNYIEGLFLSSGVVRGPDYTMERMLTVVRSLRRDHRFGGYIHVKVIPGADPRLVHEAGLYADRMSVNIELPSRASLTRLAPQKEDRVIFGQMAAIGQRKTELSVDRQKPYLPHTPRRYVPAGQSTQMIIGASPEDDRTVLTLSEALYRRFQLKRVYFSAYQPINHDARLPAATGGDGSLLRREHRLYQADWLLRFYRFRADEVLPAEAPRLDLDLDPKAAWALRHFDCFPVEINRADYRLLLRVPGIGVRSAKRIVKCRREAYLTLDGLKRLGVVLKRAQYFITCGGVHASGFSAAGLTPDRVRGFLSDGVGTNVRRDREWGQPNLYEAAGGGG